MLGHTLNLSTTAKQAAFLYSVLGFSTLALPRSDFTVSGKGHPLSLTFSSSRQCFFNSL